MAKTEWIGRDIRVAVMFPRLHVWVTFRLSLFLLLNVWSFLYIIDNYDWRFFSFMQKQSEFGNVKELLSKYLDNKPHEFDVI